MFNSWEIESGPTIGPMALRRNVRSVKRRLREPIRAWSALTLKADMGGQKGVRRLPANPGLMQRSRELAIRRLPTSAAAASVSWPWSRILSSSDRSQILDCNDTEQSKAQRYCQAFSPVQS